MLMHVHSARKIRANPHYRPIPSLKPVMTFVKHAISHGEVQSSLVQDLQRLGTTCQFPKLDSTLDLHKISAKVALT